MTDRAERLSSRLSEAGLDAILVTDLVNVRYLTGYYGSNGVAVVGPEVRSFITDFRYVQQAAEQVDPSFERRQAPLELFDTLPDALPTGGSCVWASRSHTSRCTSLDGYGSCYRTG